MLQNMLIEQLSKFSKLQNFFEKKLEMFFFVILRILKVVRSAYFVTFFVTRMYKSSSVLKPALYTVVAANTLAMPLGAIFLFWENNTIRPLLSAVLGCTKFWFQKLRITEARIIEV